MFGGARRPGETSVGGLTRGGLPGGVWGGRVASLAQAAGSPAPRRPDGCSAWPHALAYGPGRPAWGGVAAPGCRTARLWWSGWMSRSRTRTVALEVSINCAQSSKSSSPWSLRGIHELRLKSPSSREGRLESPCPHHESHAPPHSTPSELRRFQEDAVHQTVSPESHAPPSV